MTDTKAPSTRSQILVGMLPSFNTSLVALVTASVSIGGTLMTQRYTAPAPAPVEVAKPVDLEPVKALVAELAAKVDGLGAGVADLKEQMAVRKARAKPKALVP